MVQPASNLRQAPLRDRDADSLLFVPPEHYEKALWTARQGLNMLLVGARGQGKTSVLRQIERELRMTGDARTAVFVDLAPAQSPDLALQLILASAKQPGEPLTWVPAVPLPGEPPEEARTRAWLDQLAGARACTFLLDNLRAEEVGQVLFGTFRDRLWEAPHQWIAAAEPRAATRWLMRPPADSFWEEVLEIDYTPSAAREMISRRLGGAPAWLDRLVAVMGTNPRRLLSATVGMLRDGSGDDNPLLARERWQARLAGLDRRAASLMAELATRPPVSASDPELLASLGWARTSLIRSLEQLEKLGLVRSWSEPDGTGRPKRLFTTTEPGRSLHD